MPILKSEIKNNYTTIPNSVIRAKDIMDSDYRLLLYLYSLPDGWKINQGYLASEFNCNRTNINRKIKRLKESGYLEIIKSDKEETDYIYVLKTKEGVSKNDVSKNDVSKNDVSKNDVSKNDTLINTNIINTNNIKTNKINSCSSYDEIRARVYQYFEKYIYTIDSLTKEELDKWLKVFNEDLVKYAIKIAVLKNKKNMHYIVGILKNWKKQNVKTLDDVIIDERKEKEVKPKVEVFDYDWLDDDEC